MSGTHDEISDADETVETSTRGDGRANAGSGGSSPKSVDEELEELRRRVRVFEMENDDLRRIASFYAGRELSSSDLALGVMTAERRAPFAQNPTVGVQGTRTQQKIVRAAMQVFDEADYRTCSVEQISEAAGCSRSSFYQYFSSKDDLFRRVSRELSRSLYVITEGSERITAGPDGRAAIRLWLHRFGELFDEYSPMFHTYDTVAGFDSEVASRGERVMVRQAEMLAGRFSDDAFWDVDRVGVMNRVITTVTRTYRWWNQLGELGQLPFPERERIIHSLADVIHRVAYGHQTELELADPRLSTPAFERPSLAALTELPGDVPGRRLSDSGIQMRERLIEAGRETFVTRGFPGTRVDDVVEAAGSSHGTFYRYFDGKLDLFRTIAFRAGRRLARTVDEIPDLSPPDGAQEQGALLDAWVQDFVSVSLESAPITREWIDAITADSEFKKVSISAVEWHRRRLAAFLAARGFGDVDADALVLVALLLHAVPRLPGETEDTDPTETIRMMLRRGFLGR